MFWFILFQIFAVIVNIYIAFTKSKKNVFLWTFIFNFLAMIVYALNSDSLGMISHVIITVRSFVYLFSVPAIVPFIFILLHIVSYFFTKGNILAVIAPSFVTYYMYFWDSLQKLRIGNSINRLMWFIYNVLTGVYILAISDFIILVANVIKYDSERKKKKKKKPKAN